MRIVVQRVKRAAVRVNSEIVGEIGEGLVLLIGIHASDTEADIPSSVDKCIHLRIFNDEQDRMNRSLLDVAGEVLAISQFTLCGDARKGRRPSFVQAARPEAAEPLYDLFIQQLRDKGVRVETGRFGARMDVEIHNSGPVTIVLES